jgi:hypothetical protein
MGAVAVVKTGTKLQVIDPVPRSGTDDRVTAVLIRLHSAAGGAVRSFDSGRAAHILVEIRGSRGGFVVDSATGQGTVPSHAARWRQRRRHRCNLSEFLWDEVSR